MGLEVSTTISGLTPSWPLAGDTKSEGDNHIRLIKSVLQSAFPNGSRPLYFRKFSTKTSNYSVVATDDETIILVDTTSGNKTITLPAVPSVPFFVAIMKVSADANTVTVSGTVSGGSLAALAQKGEAYAIGGDGTAYWDLSNTIVRAGSVTYAKMQSVTASRLLGNPTGGAAVPSEISLDSATLEFSGTSIRLLSSLLSELRAQGTGITGLTLSTAGSSSTFSVAAGRATDVAFGGWMQGTALNKTTSSWAVGNNAGALDTGSIQASQTYHVFIIKRVDTGVVDYLISRSPTNPTMPASYTLKRRIGSILTNASSQWRKFTQSGNEFILDTMVADVNAVTTSATRSTITLTVPTDVVMNALFRGSMNGSGACVFTSLLETDQAPSNVGPADLLASTSSFDAGSFERITSTAAQIATRSSGAAATYSVYTFGWRDVTLYA